MPRHKHHSDPDPNQGPEPELDNYPFSTLNSPKLSAALDAIVHYHLKHTTDGITRVCQYDGPEPSPEDNTDATQTPNIVIYITAEPEAIAHLKQATARYFSPKEAPSSAIQ